MREGYRLSIALVALLLLHPAPVAADPANDTAADPAFGLAHVDLMDLHVDRLPAGGARANERLPAADLADRFARARSSGAGWDRWSLYWDMVEQPGGAYDWSAADGIVGRDVAAGLRTLAILQGTPAQHATGGFAAASVPAVGGWSWRLEAMHASTSDAARPPVQASPPKGLDQPIFRRADGSPTDDPAQAAGVNDGNPWARFVDAAVERYRPEGVLARSRNWADGVGVRAWEVGNEPNLAHFWSGTPAQFVRYLEVAYLVIRRRDPGATVLHGGIADDTEAGAWYVRFIDALKARAAASPLPARHGYYFDKAAWHWYTYPSLLQTRPPQVRALLTDRGLPAKPIWVTEMGVPIWNEHPGPCWDPVSPWRATAVEQASYYWQAMTEGRASGVETMIAFQLYDDCGNGPGSYDAFGLVRNHASNQCWTPPQGQSCWRMDPATAGTPRAGFDAFTVAARELAGTELLWRPPREADFWQRVLFYRPPDRRVMVLWNPLRADRTVEVFATGSAAAEVITLNPNDGRAESSSLRPVGGKLSLLLAGATNRNNPGNQAAVMAGRPVIVIERDATGPFRAQVEPLPSTSAPALQLSIAAADGGTGVGAFRVHVAEGSPPTQPQDWRLLTSDSPWTAAPLSGAVRVPFAGVPGRTYHFAAQARDRAGNWSALPTTAQATTRIEGEGAVETPPATATATAVPTSPATTTGAPTPSATSTATAVPSSTATEATAPTSPAPATTVPTPPGLTSGAFLPIISPQQ